MIDEWIATQGNDCPKILHAARAVLIGALAKPETDHVDGVFTMYHSQSRKNLALPLILLALACPVAASAADNGFNGRWAYEQTCGAQHVASVQLAQTGNQVSGKWSDGSTRGSGTSGQLEGSVANGKLFVRYCGDDENSDANVCPSFDSETSDYFMRDGADLVWYRISDSGKKGDFDKYLVLHRVVAGQPAVKDDRCDDN
jgi:hypothetical protein